MSLASLYSAKENHLVYLKFYVLAYLKESLSNASYIGFRDELKSRIIESRISQESLIAKFLKYSLVAIKLYDSLLKINHQGFV